VVEVVVGVLAHRMHDAGSCTERLLIGRTCGNPVIPARASKDSVPYPLPMAPDDSSDRCPFCGHSGLHVRSDRSGSGGSRSCEDCDRCWAEQQDRERPPHY